MVKKEKKAEYRLIVRFTESQIKKIKEMVELSEYNTLSSFIRSRLLSKSNETKIDEILEILKEKTK